MRRGPRLRESRRWWEAVSGLLGALLLAGAAGRAPAGVFLDDFNRPAGTDMGPGWVERYADWGIAGDRARSEPAPQAALMTVDGFASAEPMVEVTVGYDGAPRPTYLALVLLYLDNKHNVFIKVQDGYDTSPPDGVFDTVWFYMGNNSQQPWGGMEHEVDDWDDLWPYFSEARLRASVVGDVACLEVDRDFDGVFESIYVRGGLPLAELGAGVGLGGYDGAVADDFLAVPEPASLALVVLGAGARLLLSRGRRPRAMKA